jgi:two-component system NarL family response regulator
LTKIIHIEDDPLWSATVAGCIAGWSEFELVGSFPTGEAVLRACRELQPKVVALDLRLPDMNGIAVLDELNALPNRPRVLLLTCRADEVTLSRVRSGDAIGVVWKTMGFGTNLRQALGAAARGARHLCPQTKIALSRLSSAPDAYHKILSPREQELIPLLADGYSDAEIAALLGRSHETVHSHRKNILSKLGLHRTEDLVRWAFEKGFIVPLMPAPPCAVGSLLK